MARKSKSTGKRAARQDTQPAATQEFSYRGRKIEVRRSRHGGGGSHLTLLIDGKEIEIEETEDGVMSHNNMFQVYGSPFELAEDLIRQWGSAEIQPAAHEPDGHEHNH
jgi:hypothetical protein